MLHIAHGFVDGGYLSRVAAEIGIYRPDPTWLAKSVVGTELVQSWARQDRSLPSAALARVTYYDARPDDETAVPPATHNYWRDIELQPDTDLGFGSLRGGERRRPPRQKGVDTLLAVDMLVGAFSQLFSIAVLIAGDADFVPVVHEVRRRGVMVVLAAHPASLSDELRCAADRFVSFGKDQMVSIKEIAMST